MNTTPTLPEIPEAQLEYGHQKAERWLEGLRDWRKDEHLSYQLNDASERLSLHQLAETQETAGEAVFLVTVARDVAAFRTPEFRRVFNRLSPNHQLRWLEMLELAISQTPEPQESAQRLLDDLRSELLRPDPIVDCEYSGDVLLETMDDLAQLWLQLLQRELRPEQLDEIAQDLQRSILYSQNRVLFEMQQLQAEVALVLGEETVELDTTVTAYRDLEYTLLKAFCQHLSSLEWAQLNEVTTRNLSNLFGQLGDAELVILIEVYNAVPEQESLGVEDFLYESLNSRTASQVRSLVAKRKRI
jgi:hypothetical protein